MYQQQFIGVISLKTSIFNYVDLLKYFSDNEIIRDDLNISFLANYDERKIIRHILTSVHIRKQGKEFIINPYCHPDYNVKICLLNSGEGDYSEVVLYPSSSIDVDDLNGMTLECKVDLMVDINYKGYSKTSIDQAIYILKGTIEKIEEFCKIERVHIMAED